MPKLKLPDFSGKPSRRVTLTGMRVIPPRPAKVKYVTRHFSKLSNMTQWLHKHSKAGVTITVTDWHFDEPQD